MIQNTEPATWHIKHLRSRTAGQRMADKIAKGMGSWKFIVYQTLFIIVWMILNMVGYIRHWDRNDLGINDVNQVMGILVLGLHFHSTFAK